MCGCVRSPIEFHAVVHVMLRCNVHLPSSWGAFSSGDVPQGSQKSSGNAVGQKTSASLQYAQTESKKRATASSVLLQMHNKRKSRSKQTMLGSSHAGAGDYDLQQQLACKPFSSSQSLIISSHEDDGAVPDAKMDPQRGGKRKKPDMSNASTGPPQSAKDACDSILSAIQRCSAFAERHPAEQNESACAVNLDHILSRVPYKEMLRDLFGSQKMSSSADRAPNVPVVAKAYEESFMRQPMFEHERLCVMGALCECNSVSMIPGSGFTAVEFLLPSEASAMSSGTADVEQQMCVLCHRKLVQKLFYDIIYAGSPYR